MIPHNVVEYVKELPPAPKVTLPELTRTQRELFIRMVFSALVDADYLDTEKHFFNEKQYLLRQNQQRIESLWNKFNLMKTKSGFSTLSMLRRRSIRFARKFMNCAIRPRSESPASIA
jgi:hypothetical protein